MTARKARVAFQGDRGAYSDELIAQLWNGSAVSGSARESR